MPRPSPSLQPACSDTFRGNKGSDLSKMGKDGSSGLRKMGKDAGTGLSKKDKVGKKLCKKKKLGGKKKKEKSFEKENKFTKKGKKQQKGNITENDYDDEYSGEEEMDDFLNLENFCKENNLGNISSDDDGIKHSDESMVYKNEDNEGEGKVIDIEYVENCLNSICKKARLNKVVKLLSIFSDALSLFTTDDVDDELHKIADSKEGNKEKKKKRTKKKKNKKKYIMNLDTSLFAIFNVLHNLDTIFYNCTNDEELSVNVCSIDSIRSKEMFSKESCNSKFLNNPSDSIYDLENIHNYKHIQIYKSLIKYFFHNVEAQIRKIKNTDICSGIIRVLKRKENLRWIISFNYGKIFLKRMGKFFIISKKNDVYFFLYILIQNMFQLLNEKKRIIFSNLSKVKREEEHEQIKKTYNMEKLIFEIYQNLFQTYLFHYGDIYNKYIIENCNHMHFKENCLIELFAYLSHDVAYTIAFRYVQLIIHKIREEFKIMYEEKKKNKNNEKCNNKGKQQRKNERENKEIRGNNNNAFDLKKFQLHSSYMMLLIKFLIRIIKQCNNLDVLTYGLTMLIIGILKTKINFMRYIPFNLQLINFLIRIMEDKKKFIPLFCYISSILNGLKSYKLVRHVSKKQAIRLTIENFDINTTLEIDEKLISDFSIAHQIYDKIYVILFDYIGLMANHISFPEFFFAIETYFKKYCIECGMYSFKSQIKDLIMHSKSTIDIILNKRKSLNIYSVKDCINHFESEELPLFTKRLLVMEKYENKYLTNMKARLSGLQNIKKGGNTYSGDSDDSGDGSDCGNSRKRGKVGKKKKDKKRKQGDQRISEQHSRTKKEKTGKEGAKVESKEDKLEVFSMSSEEDEME
ncbi:nucleolar complex protein 2, putative [Plasmodium ovale curtisi]|uniref:Nucleolar complex protein 2, putative n=2 Tax=Plasmodium ovale TaxID=36330 RepID=A0A1A8WV55_PLAOA|nr:nucleolar complex protein 2, putative [Plasmodium ovale curtisi]SBS96220.1 nucleolar complex protein 2, putative [Plasmodium ovale curtisi]